MRRIGHWEAIMHCGAISAANELHKLRSIPSQGRCSPPGVFAECRTNNGMSMVVAIREDSIVEV